ncbi:hypothetical protein CAEBREN_29574 [Caenorhabditis brenneri]|uniref:Uncharacterized protein n=1 Tax=Caenorhabditis brenneri TaxID=135651 RepID=G0MS68_CAEBE|nr:hypothetical protein CAEBREN_29574 [Caenorhabditis brenneri]
MEHPPYVNIPPIAKSEFMSLFKKLKKNTAQCCLCMIQNGK